MCCTDDIYDNWKPQMGLWVMPLPFFEMNLMLWVSIDFFYFTNLVLRIHVWSLMHHFCITAGLFVAFIIISRFIKRSLESVNIFRAVTLMPHTFLWMYITAFILFTIHLFCIKRKGSLMCNHPITWWGNSRFSSVLCMSNVDSQGIPFTTLHPALHFSRLKFLLWYNHYNATYW